MNEQRGNAYKVICNESVASNVKNRVPITSVNKVLELRRFLGVLNVY